MPGARPLFGSFGAAAALLLGCGAAQSTQRVLHGELVDGPYVEPEAYAAFAEGAYLEQRGDYPAALDAYRRAQALDRHSPGIAARLGALTCRTNLEAALKEFQTDDIARDYPPAWTERARCLHQHGDATRALDAAERAVMLDPGNADANLLIAEIHRAQNRPERAQAWLFAWALADPEAASYAEELRARARLLGDRALAELARSNRRRDRDSEPDDEATADADPSPRRLALLATSRGEPDVAARQAALALDANPDDSDALVLGLFAASASLDEPRFLQLLAQARAAAAPAPETAALLAELLRWRVGDDAAERWLSGYRELTRATASRARAPREPSPEHAPVTPAGAAR